MSEPLIAGIELGGTKCNVVLASGRDDVREQVRIPTTTPDETLGQIVAVLARWQDFAGIGIASFGPVGVDPARPDYGRVTGGAKPGWQHADIVGAIRARFRQPVGFETDVVGAALGEGEWGAAQGLDSFAYVTVGTGIGAGLIAHGAPVEGMTHSELGHIRPARLRDDHWMGSCPYHGACVEGLASGPAIRARTGTPPPEIAADDPVWEPVAYTLAQLCHVLVATGVPKRIIMGGGVMMGNSHLFPRVRQMLKDSLGGYIDGDLIGDWERYVVPPSLGNDAGPMGAIVLGRRVLEEARPA